MATYISNRDKLLAVIQLPSVGERTRTLINWGFSHNDNKCRYEWVDSDGNISAWVNDEVLDYGC